MDSNSPEERIFDEFFDAMLRGEIQSPEEFLAMRGEVPESLREHLLGVHRMLADDSEAPAPLEQAPLPAEEGLPWQRLDEFRLIRRLGEGGMGVVFLAEQESLGRLVALKVLRPGLESSPVAVKRFEREAHAVARMTHPNIVRIFAFGEAEGVNYLAMELAPGQDLDKLLDEESEKGATIEIPRVLRWCSQLAEALHSAHEAGVIHRDVKPSNVRITPDDDALLLDFGVAREIESDQMTLTRSFLGSPSYMAPEQIALKGGQVDARSDVYALGITLYQCLTGAVPFQRDTVEEVFHDVLVETPAPPRQVRPELSRDLETVILKAIDKDPNQRFQTAAAFAKDLRALLNYLPIEARPPGLFRRGLRLARKHVVATALLLAVPVALTALATGLFVDRKVKRNAALNQTNALINQFREDVGASAFTDSRVSALQGARESGYMSAELEHELDLAEDQVQSGRESREEAFYQALDLIRRAEDLGADDLTVSELRAQLYMTKYQEACNSGDPLLRNVYLKLVRRHDPSGAVMAQHHKPRWFEIECNIDGAEVHLFHQVHTRHDLGQSDRRWVPVATQPDVSPVKPGAFCLEIAEDFEGFLAGDLLTRVAGHPIRDTILVTKGAGQIQIHDRLRSIGGHSVEGLYEVDLYGTDLTYLPKLEPLTIQEFVFERGEQLIKIQGRSIEQLGIEVATPMEVARRGGASATLYSSGSLSEVVLPKGLYALETGAPLILSEASLIGTTPLERFDQGNDRTLAFFIRAPGYEPQIFTVQHDVKRVVNLVPAGTTPRGFAHILSPFSGWDPDRDNFWMQRHEVTFKEYLKFINDPATLRTMEASSDPILRPRGGIEQAQDKCSKNADGTYGMLNRWPEDIPVLGVSWFDAIAYADWMTAQARANNLPYTYSLPTQRDWLSAASPHRLYPYGDRFTPKWIGSCFAKPLPYPQRIMTYPLDRSLPGVYDISGNVSEWTNEWWVEEQQRRWHTGGSWSDGGPATMFTVQGGNGTGSHEVLDQIGFRLVLRIDGQGQ